MGFHGEAGNDGTGQNEGIKAGGTIARRSLLKGVAALAGAGAAGAMAAPFANGAPAKDSGNSRAGLTIEAGADEAVAATEAGKVAGYIRKGIFTFKGIPYGDTTAGANRFMPPVKPKSWSGVRSSRQFGYVAPQAPRAGWANDEEAFLFSWNDGIQNEDCLHVNVWTPGLADGK